MVNSASQALAEFKNQRLGGLLSGFDSRVSAPSIVGSSLSDTASSRMARSAPKRSSTAFLNSMRERSSQSHQLAMGNIYAKKRAEEEARRKAAEAARQQQMAQRAAGFNQRYVLPGVSSAPKGSNGTVAYGGRYGLQKPASAALTALEGAYSKEFGQGFQVNSGWRSYADQVKAKQYWSSKGQPNKAATPGTSQHGWGLAIDFGGPIQNTNSKQHAWLRQNAASFGWYWVGQRYGEPWHWEYHPEWNRQ